jgi:two-component system phosphate regulon sensor histidine kinase PhoR
MEILKTPATNACIKILIVDDDQPNSATILARAIAKISPRVEVISVMSGHETLQEFKDEAVDILITDMNMPVMKCLELIEQLYDRPARRPTFCFLMTACQVPGLKVLANRLKVKDVITKLMSPEQVCQIITKAIEEIDQVKVVCQHPASKKRYTILVADPQPDNQTLLARYLQNQGYGYIQARDGSETLEKVRTELPDLVLLDVNMPDQNGFMVLSEICSNPLTQHIPVIILTAAQLDPTDVQTGLNMGADDYVAKPFDSRELFARIRTKLRVKESENALRRRNRELNLLPEIGRELNAGLNMEDLSTILLKRTVETFGAMFGHVVLFNIAGTFQKTYQLDSFVSQFALPHGLLEIVNETRQGFIVDDTHHDARWESSREDVSRSAVVVPMFGRHNLLGVLVLTHEQPDYFTPDHLLLLHAIISQASIAVENAQLYDKVLQEQQRLDAVLQSAADAILMFDADGCLSLVNPAGQKLFTDHETKTGQRLASGAGYDSFIQLLEQALLFNASFSGEVVWPDKRVFSALMTPAKEGGIVVVLHDVTRFKELERVKDEFVATASHDLRNPITSIKGFNMLIRKAGPLNDSQNEFVERIHHAAENMEELVKNMLDLSKMDLDAEQKHETMDLTPMLWQLANEFQPYAQLKKQLLALGQTEVNSTIQGNPLKIRQALRNLIGNAIKYTPNSGVVILSIKHASDMACIQIQDTGYGIPPADLPHIFDRFYRAHSNGHADIEGNGLGLAIVKAIAEGHGGDVTVESEVGKGSCFILKLPLVRSENITMEINRSANNEISS